MTERILNIIGAITGIAFILFMMWITAALFTIAQ